MCRLQKIAVRDYQESVTTGQTHGRTDRQTERQTPDKVIPMCCYALQVTQKLSPRTLPYNVFSALDLIDLLFGFISLNTHNLTNKGFAIMVHN